MPRPQPSKPFRGWAVFDSDGYALGTTTRDTRAQAKAAWLGHFLEGTSWSALKKAGYTARKVIVSEPSEGGK